MNSLWILLFLGFFGMEMLMPEVLGDSPHLPIQQPASPAELSQYLKKLKQEIDTLAAHQSADSLYLLQPKFELNLEEAPDSIRKQFRFLCMTYAFHYYRELGDYSTALHYYLRAHESVQDPLYLDPLSWYIENEIASIYTRLGDYEKSEFFSGMVEASLQHYHQDELLSRLYTNMGTNQRSRGNLPAALLYFEKGLQLADSLRYAPGIFSNSLSLAEINLDLARDSLAEHYLIMAEKIIHLLKDNNRYLEKKSGLEAALGQLSAHQGHYRESVQNYQAAVVSLQNLFKYKRHREFAKLYVELAKNFLQLDVPDSAQQCLEQGMLSLIPDFTGTIDQLDTLLIYQENSFIDLLQVQYDLYQQEYGKTRDTLFLHKALSCVYAGLFANNLLTRDLVLDPSKLTAIENNKHLTNAGIETLYQLNSIHPALSRLNQVRELFTRSKSILYNEKIRNLAIRQQMSDEELAMRDSIEKEMLIAVDKKFEEAARFELINAELVQLQEKLDVLLSGHRDIRKPVIHPDHYIEYLQTDTAIYSFSSVQGPPQFLKLGTSGDFEQLLGRLKLFMTLKEVSSDSLIVTDLYRFLLGPLQRTHIPRLVIIPDGEISLIPFEMLEDDQGEKVLAHTALSYEYQYEPYRLNQDVRDKPIAVFCLAPTYSIPAPISKLPSRGSLYALPFAKSEADTIRRIIGKKVFIAEDLNKTACEEVLKKARIFHFSGHAIVKPEVAFLALNDKSEMGQQMTDQEISLLSNPMDLVVLSACETGLGKWDYGEGIRSLGRSFMEAGAGAAVYSLWNVNDRSTARLMSSFYQYLKRGCPKDIALQKAKLDFLKQVKGANAHPFHWAAFVAVGDMRPVFQKDPFPLLITAILLVLSIILWTILSKQKRSS